MKNQATLIFLTVVVLTNIVSAQNDSLNRKFKSIKSYTLGTLIENKSELSIDDSRLEERYETTLASLGRFKDVNLFIYITDNDTIYKLSAEGMSCGNSTDKAATFRTDIQEYYGITFKLLPVKPSTPYKLPVNGGQYGKDVEYVYVAYKNGVKYTLTTINSGMGVSPSKISMFFWKISFSMTDIDFEKRKKQQDKIKSLQEQNDAKSNF